LPTDLPPPPSFFFFFFFTATLTHRLSSSFSLLSSQATFDRFASAGLITAPEVLQALLEAGLTAPRKVVVQYLRGLKVLPSHLFGLAVNRNPKHLLLFPFCT
jgi:hypothetical protein